MAQIVPIQTGAPDTNLPSAPQLSTKYVLTGPDGTRAVFNDSSDRDYVGAITELTGLDSPDVRENADDLVQMDGGVHGDFYYGRRPITMTGKVFGMASAAERNVRLTKLMRASNALRRDATLLWTPDGGAEQYVTLRRQQPLRISEAWVKTFQLAMVAADPRIYSSQLYTSQVAATGSTSGTGRTYPKTYPMSYGVGSAAITGQLFVTNQGNTPSPGLIVIQGPGTNPTVTNFSTGQSLPFFITLGATDFLALDLLNRTVLLNNQSSRYGALDFANASWFMIEPGVNDLRLSWTNYTAGAAITAQYRDAWI